MLQKVLFASAVAAAGATSIPSPRDLAKASTPLPRAYLTGSTFESRARVLNEALDTLDDLQVKQCAEYTLEELIAVWETLKASTNEHLNDVYERGVDNRRLSGLPDGFSLPKSDQLEKVLRDSLCIESVMLYAHHLGAAEKDEFHALSTLPTMPSTEHKQEDFDHSDEETKRVFHRYQEVRTCDICHADPVEIVNPDAPSWAEEFFTVLSQNSSTYEGVSRGFRAALRYYSWPLRSYR